MADSPPVAERKTTDDAQDCGAAAPPELREGEAPSSYGDQSIRGLENDFALCEKPKCRALRSFFLARLWVLRKGDKKKGKENIELALHYLNHEDFPDDDEGRLRRKVLRLMVSTFQDALANGVFDALGGGDAKSGAEREDKKDGSLSTDEEDHEPVHPVDSFVFVLEDLDFPVDRAMYYYLRGKYFSYTHHFNDAIPCFLKSLKESPESTFALVALGSYCRIGRRVGDRFTMPSFTLELKPLKKKWDRTRDVRAASRLAVVKLESLKISRNRSDYTFNATVWEDEWKEILELAVEVEKDGGKAEDLTHCADIFASSPKKFGMKPRAEALYRRSLELRPSSSFTHHKLGKYLALHGKTEEGLTHLQRAMDLAPFGNFAANIDYICIRYCTEDFDADPEFERLLQIKEHSCLRLHLLVGWAQYKAAKGDFEAALRLIEEAAILDEKFGYSPDMKYDPFPTSQWASLLEAKEEVVPNASLEQNGRVAGRSKGWEANAGDLLWRRGVTDGRNEQIRSRGFSNNAGWNGNQRGNSWRGAGSTVQEGNARRSFQPERRQFPPRRTLAEIRKDIEEKAAKSQGMKR